MRLQARSFDSFLAVARVLADAGIDGAPIGGNAFELADGTELDPDVQAALADLVVEGTFDVVPPVDVGQGAGPATTASAHQPPATPAPQPEPRPAEPPRTGPGATREAWADYAASIDIDVTADMGRDDIIRAVEAHPDDR